MNGDTISRSALLKKSIRVSEFDEGGWERVLRAVPVEEIEKAEASGGALGMFIMAAMIAGSDRRDEDE